MTRVPLMLAVLAAACLPPDKTDAPHVAPVDPDVVATAHRWTVEDHVRGGNTALTEGDAILMHGRVVRIGADDYSSPFNGSCDTVKRAKRTRKLDDILPEVEISGEGRRAAIRFGLTPVLDEYRLTCDSSAHATTLVLYVAGKRGMTCFSGVCYLLAATD